MNTNIIGKKTDLVKELIFTNNTKSRDPIVWMQKLVSA